MLGHCLLGARVDERLDRQDAKREHVELADDRDPGWEIDGTDDESERTQHRRLGSHRNPIVPDQAVGQLGVHRDLGDERPDVAERQVHVAG